MKWALTNNVALYVWICIEPMEIDELRTERETMRDNEYSLGDTCVSD